MVGTMMTTKRQPEASASDLLLIVVPGFGSGDAYTAPLRHHLKQSGFRAEGWGLGTNRAGVDLPHTLDDLSDSWEFEAKPNYRGEGAVAYLCDRLKDRVQQRHAETGCRIALIGWSLGGYLAREAARDLPQIVDRVITMGSPVIGGPKYTAAADFFRRRHMDLDWIEAQILKRDKRPIEQPITAIFSKSDGIVSWRAAIDHHSKNVQHIEVDAAHLGMGFNPAIWSHVLEALG
jgi:fermentation-respiration switch protein FrsA (DUF1100 family)